MFKNRLTAVEVTLSSLFKKELNNINANIKTYQIEIQNLRQTK